MLLWTSALSGAVKLDRGSENGNGYDY